MVLHHRLMVVISFGFPPLKMPAIGRGASEGLQVICGFPILSRTAYSDDIEGCPSCGYKKIMLLSQASAPLMLSYLASTFASACTILRRCTRSVSVNLVYCFLLNGHYSFEEVDIPPASTTLQGSLVTPYSKALSNPEISGSPLQKRRGSC